MKINKIKNSMFKSFKIKKIKNKLKKFIDYTNISNYLKILFLKKWKKLKQINYSKIMYSNK